MNKKMWLMYSPFGSPHGNNYFKQETSLDAKTTGQNWAEKRDVLHRLRVYFHKILSTCKR